MGLEEAWWTMPRLLGWARPGALGLVLEHANPMPLPCSPSHVGLGSGWQLLSTDAPLPVGLSTGRWGWGESQLCSQPVAQE